MKMKPALLVAGATLLVVATVMYTGFAVGRRYQMNHICCLVPKSRNLPLAITETFGLTRWYAQSGQDRWVLEAVFPGLATGFFVDIGSWDGTIGSNSKALEERGWHGICIDPFPRNMQGRTCQMFRDVVYSESGKRVTFRMADALGGIDDHIGRWKEQTRTEKTVALTTLTLGEILDQARAPSFIHFISLDIEGAELHALRGFPFDRYRMGAMVVEHNYEQPKRDEIEALMHANGYRRVHSWREDDYYVPVDSKLYALDWMQWR
jgi:FkbM family methyltransferase